jgi:hypoxanthine phosphoribosyltransferase
MLSLCNSKSKIIHNLLIFGSRPSIKNDLLFNYQENDKRIMVPLSFTEIAERLRSLDLPKTDLVIGIGTGGFVPASLVAFHLNCELQIITLNYRDETNTPRYENPVVVNMPPMPELVGKQILLVDDVSASGKTLQEALLHFRGLNIKTLTMKGKADFVLFPEVKDCVNWPWK